MSFEVAPKTWKVDGAADATLPEEGFGWPTCAQRAAGAGHDQTLPPPPDHVGLDQMEGMSDEYDLIKLGGRNIGTWWWVSPEVAPTSPDIAQLRAIFCTVHFPFPFEST